MASALQQLTSTLFGSGENSGVIVTVFNWITSSDVLQFFAIGIACSLGLFSIKAIRSVIWGA